MKRNVSRILSGVLVVYFGLNGVLKLAAHPHMVESFASWGYSRAFMMVIGVIELLAAVALAIPRFARMGAAALIAVLVGALGTHLRYGEYAHALIPLAVMPLVIAAVVPHRRGRPSSPGDDESGSL